MIRYEVRGFGAAGEYRFGATLRAADDNGAIARFAALAQTAERMELYRGAQRITVRLADDRLLRREASPAAAAV